VISTAADTVTATIPVGTTPGGVAVSPDGGTAYVPNYDSNTVSAISTATNTVTVTIPFGAGPYGVAATDVPTAAPAVTGISPSSGPQAGGTSVTITGNGFTGATAVNFGAVPATGFTVDSDTQITATAPSAASAGTVNVTVTTAGGTSAAATADQYTYS
jgi:YVTN family beta-propeller protein